MKVVRALFALTRLPPKPMGFHTDSIVWNQQALFPFDEQSKILSHITSSTGLEKEILLEKLAFVAGGLVGRGTRVWRSDSPLSPNTVVKYSWRSTRRMSEGDLYSLALGRGVIGLLILISYSSYQEINGDVRRAYTPSLPSDLTAQYQSLMCTHNRILTRLVFGTTGITVQDPSLSSLEITRALLAAVVVHGSLFFDADILHRDISPNNIIYCPQPTKTAATKACLDGMELQGSLIDPDYAVDQRRTKTRTIGHSIEEHRRLMGVENLLDRDLESRDYVRKPQLIET